VTGIAAKVSATATTAAMIFIIFFIVNLLLGYDEIVEVGSYKGMVWV
jgi:uncharacterized membrane protein YtjA (UPF0391 family)